MTSLTEEDIQDILSTVFAQLGHSSQGIDATTSSSLPSLNSLFSSIPEFTHDPEADETFSAWYGRYEDLFQIDAAKGRLLLRKLSRSVHKKLINYIMPRHLHDLPFNQIVQTLSDMSGPQSYLFNLRYNCLKVKKDEHDDFMTYGNKVNSICSRFRLRAITEDQFKSLIFICGLQSSKDANIRLPLLSKHEREADVSIPQLADECNRLINLTHDAERIENSVSADPANIATVSGPRKTTQPGIPKTPFWLWRAWHYVRECSFRNHCCTQCYQFGHKNGFSPRNNSPADRQRSKIGFFEITNDPPSPEWMGSTRCHRISSENFGDILLFRSVDVQWSSRTALVQRW